MIRPFQLSDIVRIQRLSRQATKLNAQQALLDPRSPLMTALSAVIPWNEARVSTYVLDQQGHRLANAGFIQAQKRASRPEADILLLSPALDTPSGHPAIWEKLLSNYIHEAARQDLERLYVDVPDQPLLVGTFAHVGFRAYARETIWRLTDRRFGVPSQLPDVVIRPYHKRDLWGIQQLYMQVTPDPVRQAEGIHPGSTAEVPDLTHVTVGTQNCYVLLEQGQVRGALAILAGRHGTWFRLWVDTLGPDTKPIHALLRLGLQVVQDGRMVLPIYTGVRDYHGGLGAVLSDYGFAPFTDRARMVKPIVAWIRESAMQALPAMEPVGEIAASSFSEPSFCRLAARQERVTTRPRREQMAAHGHCVYRLHMHLPAGTSAPKQPFYR